ncbi:MAG TPA: CHASE2 domain-containing protein [Oligoflexia bacterium]|nr:CHASE2 domain-containing protein [Oligoflexia bacterium]HMP48988.1 CHASE2 domain-containing protein [Oligoflexia bacterium]
MNHHITHLRYLIRKILRDESRPGNLKRWGIAGVFSVLTVVLGFFIPDQMHDTILLKTLYSLRGAVDAPSELVIVSIDDESFKRLGASHRKPFPREMSARALNSIQDDEPKVVILDLDIVEEADQKEATEKLAAAIGRGPVSIGLSPVRDKGTGEETLIYSDPIIRKAAKYETEMNLNYINEMASYIHLMPGKYKSGKVPLERSIPFMKLLREEVTSDLKIPGALDLIRFYGPAGSIRSFSIWQFFSEERVIPKGFFKDKIVVVGFKSDMKERGTSDKEILNVPVKSSDGTYGMYGVEIHASIVGNLLEGRWIKTVPLDIWVCSLFVLLFILYVGILNLEPLQSFFYMIAFLVVWFLATLGAFSYLDYFVPGVFLALFMSTLVFSGAACASATLALKELRELKKTLGIN